MSTAIVVLRLLAVSQLLLSAGALAASRDPVPIRVAGVALAMGTICYLVFPLIGADAQRGVAAGAAMLAQAIPLLLFAFVWQVFEDEQRLPMALWPAAAAFLVLVAMLEFDRDARVAAAATSLAILVQVAKLAFALAAMLVVWKGRESDLDEARLRLRRVFAAGTAGVVAAVVTTELVARWRVPQLVEALGMALIFVLVYTINLALLRRNRSFTLVDLRAPTATPAAPSPVLEALTRLMCEQRLYAEPDLRIAGLAARLKIPEYQLRRTINGLLGYRNFNQFVNRYRIEEAAQRLLAEPRTPVLTIALDVGFRSLSSFNAAFRAHYERSPTEYRASAPTNF